MRPPLPSKPYYRSTSEGKINRINYEFLHSSGESPLDSYDYLRPPRGESQSASQSPLPQNRGGHDIPQTTILSGSPRDRRSSSTDHLCASPSGLKHRRIYEELSPRDADDGDTYVYMAPLKDFPEAAAQQQQEQTALNSPSKANVSSVIDVSGNTALDSSSELRSVHGSCHWTIILYMYSRLPYLCQTGRQQNVHRVAVVDHILFVFVSLSVQWVCCLPFEWAHFGAICCTAYTLDYIIIVDVCLLVISVLGPLR